MQPSPTDLYFQRQISHVSSVVVASCQNDHEIALRVIALNFWKDFRNRSQIDVVADLSVLSRAGRLLEFVRLMNAVRVVLHY